MNPKDHYNRLATQWGKEARRCEMDGMHLLAENARRIALTYKEQADAYPDA